MRKLFLLAAFLAAAAPAMAADIPPPAPPPADAPPPLFTWTGFYLGGQIGYAWGTDRVTVNPFGFGTNFTPNGVVGGAHIGYNLQLNQFVAGLEGDVEGTGISRTFSPGGVVYDTNVPVQGSIRARLGIGFDRVLLYATGGAAFAGFETTVTGFGVDRTSQTRAGWTVGGGIEYAVTPNWSIRAEYRYADFGSFTYATPLAFGVGSSVRHQETENAVRAGFSYRFGPFGAPAY
ncbi:MAG: porin family protein [Beijerinckiaceae bacterium]|nr:porin family protein [Beijerinckiaceae bacterium]